jgi:hypothetical protein
MIDCFRIDDADLALLDEARHRNHEREFIRLALVIARHRDRGLLANAGEHDLRGFVEHFRVRLGHIEAAECARGARGHGELGGDGGKSDAGLQARAH